MQSNDDRTHQAQQKLLTLSSDLERVDAELEHVIDSLDDVEGALSQEMASAVDAVRRDLLADAAQTLRFLSHASDATARARQLEVQGASERLLAGTA